MAPFPLLDLIPYLTWSPLAGCTMAYMAMAISYDIARRAGPARISKPP